MADSISDQTVTPVRLKKVSLSYNSREDRVRMDALDTDDRAHSFWLTQRLCLQLVQGLLNSFDTPDDDFGSSGGASAVPKRAASESKEVQKFLQDKARVGRAPAPAAVEPASENAILVTKAQLRRADSNGVLQLIFPLEPESTALLTMSPEEARLLLDIFYQQFRAGSWPMAIWPEWVRAGHGKAGRGARSVSTVVH